jgi:hypothetical protein
MRGNWLELLGKRVFQCQIQLVIRMASASTHCARRRSSGLFIFLAELIKFCPRGGANSLLQVQPTNIKLIKQRALFACGQEGEWVRGKRAWPPAVRPSAFLAIPPHYSALRFASHLPAFNQTRLRRGPTHYISGEPLWLNATHNFVPQRQFWFFVHRIKPLCWILATSWSFILFSLIGEKRGVRHFHKFMVWKRLEKRKA